MRRLLLLGMLVVLAGCGSDERAAAPTPSSTSLAITVDPDGPDGPQAAKQRRCEGADCPDVPTQAFEPVRPKQVCTDIFGGPQTAAIEGTLRGRKVEARFSKQNGCEIARWNLAKALLEP
jgi:hypothetical protein